MKIPTIKVIFDRKNKSGANIPGIVEIRVAMNNRIYYISTGTKCLRRDFSEGAERVSIMRRKIDEYINGCITDNKAMSINDMRSYILREDESDFFIDFVSERADSRPVRDSTKKRYNVLINMLEEYGRIKTFADLTPEGITRFDEYLHKVRRNGKPYMQSNIYSYHRTLKAFCNDAVLFDKIERNPYCKLRFDRGNKQTIEFLTEDELDKISKIELPSMLLEHARDLFIFQTCTALSYSDLCKFDISLYDKIDGRYFRKGTRTKTGVVYASELLPPAVAMLDKYDNKLPIISNQKYNYALKFVALAAGVNKPLHSHMARSTFATYALSHGASIESVSVMLGHTNITQTLKRYAEILPSSVLKDYKKLDGLLQ